MKWVAVFEKTFSYLSEMVSREMGGFNSKKDTDNTTNRKNFLESFNPPTQMIFKLLL